jgi:tetratricopeptide (TPR) repeat protein
MLNLARPAAGFKVINKGIPGTDSDTILSELHYNLNTYKPRMVIVMMGLNDESSYPYGNYRMARAKFFLRQFRIYKLAQLLYARLHNKESLKDVYLERGRAFLELEHYPESEAMFKKALALSPSGPLAYAGLGWYYYQRAMYVDAENSFRKVFDLSRNNPLGYIELGWYYCKTGKIALAEEMFKKAVEKMPNDPDALCGYAQFYQSLARYPEAEALFKKAIAVCPNNASSFSQLGWMYYEQGKYDLAGQLFVHVMRLDKDNLAVYKDIGFVKQTQHNQAEADRYFRRVREFNIFFYRITSDNYRMLKDAVLKKGNQLVCVQYPMRSLKELTMMFDTQENIVFVDNEMNFREAVAREGFNAYFEDRVGWDFGHCTAKGNYLLARAVADAILKEFRHGQN